MRSRSTNSSSRIHPAPAVSSGDPFTGYSRALQQVLDLHEKATGVRIDLEALRDASVAASVAEAARRAVLTQRRAKARAAGRRAGTISGRFYPGGRVPYLRLSGHWLGAVGFDLGQAVEIEVGPGELVIRRL
jgi:hypothetical protein